MADVTLKEISMDINTLDRIHIRDLNCNCILGVFAEERLKTRQVIISLTIFYDNPKAARTDDIANAIDYDVLSKKLHAHVGETSFELIESLAESVADLLLAEPLITACQVTVEKPDVPAQARGVAVEIFRSRVP